MSEPTPSWPKLTSVSPKPTFHLMRWLASALILLALAMASHTSGRTARLVTVAARHWVSHTTRIKGISWLSAFTPHNSRVLSRPTSPGPNQWLPMVAHATLREGYGWHGKGAKATFGADVELKADDHAPIMAGMSGKVVKVTNESVTIKVSPQVTVAFKGVASRRVKVGQSVSPETVLGRVGSSSSLAVTVKDQGYPVNPLGPRYFGSRWLTH